MKTTRYLGKGIVGACLLAGMLATQANARGPGYMFCEAEYRDHSENGDFEVYVSNVFSSPSFVDDEIDNSYLNFVEAKYSPALVLYDVTCERQLYNSEREARDRRNKAISQWRSSEFKVRQVRWSY